jgi:predicted nucleotidyltransferase
MGMTKLHVLEVAQLFNDHSVDYWLIGGWAIDFLLESESDHKDMDFFVVEHQKIKTLAALESIGFRKLEDSWGWEDGNTFYERDDALIDLAPITSANTPKLVGEYAALEFPKELLETRFLEMEGTRVRTISPEMHIAIKHSIGAAFGGLREKDLAEILLLEHHVRNHHVQ